MEYMQDPNLERDIEQLKIDEEGGNFNIPNHAPAGHSLTDAPGQSPWETPPTYSNPEEAFNFVVNQMEKGSTRNNFSKLMFAGVPVEAIVNTITFTGFAEGLWTPDLGEILKLPIAMHLIGIAMENNIPAQVFNIDPKEAIEKKELPDEDMMAIMEEKKPQNYDKIMNAVSMLEEWENIEPSDIEEEEVVNPSFMNMNENIEGEI